MESGEDSKIVESGGRRRPPAAGMGRKRGSLNKTTRTLKESLLRSFDKLGGEAWLVSLAESDPKTYASLLGRLIPAEIQGDVTMQSGAGGVILIPEASKTVAEWRERWGLDQPKEQIEGGNNGKIA